MQIISWNVASVRARLPLLLRLLAEKRPDIVLLQEIKATDETFPFETLKKAGYTAFISGQKGFNGVAVLSKNQNGLIFTPDFNDSQSRLIIVQEAQTLFISAYAPNGSPPAANPNDTSRLIYKLNWFQKLRELLLFYLNQNKMIILGGDFNVIEEDTDVYNPDLFRNSPLMIPPVREAFQSITELALINVLKTVSHNLPLYSYWDFQMGAFRRNWGIMLDYIFIPASWKSRLKEAGVYREYRAAEKPSDHAPVYCFLFN